MLVLQSCHPHLIYFVLMSSCMLIVHSTNQATASNKQKYILQGTDCFINIYLLQFLKTQTLFLCCDGHCCGSQVAYFGCTIDCFPLLETPMLPYSFVKSNSQVRFMSCPAVPEVQDVFSNKDSSFISEQQAKALAIVYKLCNSFGQACPKWGFC